MITKYNYNDIMKLKHFLLIPLLVSSIWFFSCSREEPKILYGFMELVYYPGRTRPEERYSFFILPEDDDGIENLDELYLYHDREGLRWLLSSEDWIRYDEDGKTWIGSRHISMLSGVPLPRGQYRAVLVNKGGERTERRFAFDGPVDSSYPFPSFSVSGGVYRVNSRYPVNRLLCYDQEGKIIQSVMITETEGSIRDLQLSANVKTSALWAENPEHRISALTEAVELR